jgi:hypothetical protein
MPRNSGASQLISMAITGFALCARRFGAAGCLNIVIMGLGLSASVLHGQPTTYNYVGQSLTSSPIRYISPDPTTGCPPGTLDQGFRCGVLGSWVSGGSPTRITLSLTFGSPLPANLDWVGICPPPYIGCPVVVSSWSISDGLHSFNQSSPGCSACSGPWSLSTDANGNIIYWSFDVGVGGAVYFESLATSYYPPGKSGIRPGPFVGEESREYSGPTLGGYAANDTLLNPNAVPGQWSVGAPQKCPVNFNVLPYAGLPPSLDGHPISMNASFTPTDSNGNVMTLAAAGAACGFSAPWFNWQQMITNQSALEEVKPADPQSAIGHGIQIANLNTAADGSLQAGSQAVPPSTPPYSDPPLGGYQYQGFFDDAYPFFWNAGDLNGPVPCTKDSTIPVVMVSTLNFQDCPTTIVVKEFITSLVGVLSCPGGATNCGALGMASKPLFWWRWQTTYDGTFGAGGVKQNKSTFPPNPHSGTGGVTITSINGAPQKPPRVSCTATPTTLWPPNGKTVMVTVIGNVTPGTQTIPSSGVTYAVIDKYGQVQPSGSFALGSGGSYSFGVPLIAARNGDDKDGRTYTINVVAADQIGNVGTCSAVVTVPHDQGH